MSRANVGKQFAVVLDNAVLTAPVIQEAITTGRGRISGQFDAASANELSILLRAVRAAGAPDTWSRNGRWGPELGGG